MHRTSTFTSLRGQAACVRMLLDEVERLAPAEASSGVRAQLVEELARLGCRALEAASELTEIVTTEERRCA